VRDAGMDRNLARDLFFIPIRDGVSLGDFSQPRPHPRREQYRRHELGLPRVAVADNADVAYPICGVGIHGVPPKLCEMGETENRWAQRERGVTFAAEDFFRKNAREE